MLPYKTMLSIEKGTDKPIYLQITFGLIRQIQAGVIKSGTKIPGTRSLAKLLEVHRKTVVHAIEELEAQGWVDIIPYRGVFVVEDLPEIKFQPLESEPLPRIQPINKPGFVLPKRSFLTEPVFSHLPLSFSDGTPDVRLAPIAELATGYARHLRDSDASTVLNYGVVNGPERLRKVLAREFNRERGLHLEADNIMVTRGSQMAIFLAAQVLLRPGDNIVVGETNYYSANLCFQSIGARLLRISVDENGLCVDELEALIHAGKEIKALYLTSHHHHPTTVTLSPDRRLRLLDLAYEYGIAIIEDDYSHDFHYTNSPILPLASADRHGVVVYIGSFSKSTAPAFRVGYVMTARQVIEEMIKYRRVIDRQGDNILELAIADLLENGTIQRYRKKALKQYRKRLDLFCEILETDFSKYTTFRRPDGGMAAWVKFDKKIALPELAPKALAEDLYISDGLNYNPPTKKLNATRMGFAKLNEQELIQSFEKLKKVIQQKN